MGNKLDSNENKDIKNIDISISDIEENTEIIDISDNEIMKYDDDDHEDEDNQIFDNDDDDHHDIHQNINANNIFPIIAVDDNKATDSANVQNDSNNNKQNNSLQSNNVNNKNNLPRSNLQNNNNDKYINCIRGFENITTPLPYKSFADIKRMMNSKFGYKEGEISIALDIISVYLKGQKLLYLEAKSYCEFYLNRLMMPCILLSSICSVISGIFNDVPIANKIISGCSALSAFLMSLISYFKLDARAEAHKSTAYSFDQLISECEFSSGKILLSNITKLKVKDIADDDNRHNSMNETNIKLNTENSDLAEGKNKFIEVYDVHYIQTYINTIERKVKEIKEKNQFIIPDIIIDRYLDIYNSNIFSSIKKFQINEFILLNNLKVVYNDCRDIENTIITNGKNKITPEIERIFREKYSKKEEHFKKIFRHRKKILTLNKKLTESIILIKNREYSCCKILY
jgi:hypothetical protein